MYGYIQIACHVFDEMPAKDVVSWNALFAGYVRLGSLYEVMGLFRDTRMVYGMSPSEATINDKLQLLKSGSPQPLGENMLAFIHQICSFLSFTRRTICKS